MESPNNLLLRERKARIEGRLRKHGITQTHITFLPYLEYDPGTFAEPYDVGCRIIIGFAIVYTIEEPSKKQAIFKWLQNEAMDKHLSATEVKYLETEIVEQQQINQLSWQLEAAYILAWALNVVSNRPSPSNQIGDAEMQEFFENVPALGDSLDSFLSQLSYRNTD
jgi:hypothetical protein